MVQYTLFIILAPLSAVGALTTFILTLVFRKKVEFISPRFMLPFQTAYIVCNFLELWNPTESGTLFWATFNYLFIVSVPVLWFIFALEYSGLRKWLKPLPILLLFTIPFITLALVVTNPLHHGFWRSFTFVPVLGSMLVMKVSEYGPWFWVAAAFNYAVFLSGVYIVLREFFRSYRFFRKQSLLIIIGMLLPLTANLVYILKLVPSFSKDYSCIAFSLGSILCTTGLFRYRFLELSSISQRYLLEHMRDGNLVLDGARRITGINTAAQRILGLKEKDVTGESVSTVFPDWDDALLPANEGEPKQAAIFISRNGRRERVEYTATCRKEGRNIVAYIITLQSKARPNFVSSIIPPYDPQKTMPVLIINLSNRITMVRHLDSILGFEGSELMSADIQDICTENVGDIFEWDETLVPLTFKRKTGEKIRAVCRIHVVTENDESPGYCMVTAIEMTFPRDFFSVQENDIIDCLGKGMRNGDIARELGIPENALKSHLKEIFRKTGAENRERLLQMVDNSSVPFPEK